MITITPAAAAQIKLSAEHARPLHPPLPLAASGEEGFEQRGGFRLADAAVNVGRVVAGGLAKEPGAVLDGTAFRIAGAEIEAP